MHKLFSFTETYVILHVYVTFKMYFGVVKFPNVHMMYIFYFFKMLHFIKYIIYLYTFRSSLNENQVSLFKYSPGFFNDIKADNDGYKWVNPIYFVKINKQTSYHNSNRRNLYQIIGVNMRPLYLYFGFCLYAK